MMKNLWSKTDMTEISLTGQSKSGGKHWVNEKKEEKKKRKTQGEIPKEKYLHSAFANAEYNQSFIAINM